ncbi:MAG TPA: hypothetical protein VM528_00305 [Burkholderiaceae bacterium]|nr:hypothetical protein [Burkholderiaceae bacterium]
MRFHLLFGPFLHWMKADQVDVHRTERRIALQCLGAGLERARLRRLVRARRLAVLCKEKCWREQCNSGDEREQRAIERNAGHGESPAVGTRRQGGCRAGLRELAATGRAA